MTKILIDHLHLQRSPSPFAINLYDNVTRLKLDVRQIASLHGPGIATLADLQAAIGQAKPASAVTSSR